MDLKATARGSLPPSVYGIARTTVRRLRPRARRMRRVVRATMRGRHAAFAHAYGRIRLQQASFRAGPTRPLLRHLDAELLVGLGLEHLRGGRLRDGVDAFDRARSLSPGNERAQRFGHQALGDLHVISGEWVPPDMTHLERFEPVSGRVLHVVGKSLPYENGYTLRTHAIVGSQRAAGLDPHVMTDDAFFRVMNGTVYRPAESIEGTRYHRIPPPVAPTGGMSVRLDRRLTLGGAVVGRVRPSVLHAASDFLNAEAVIAWGQRFDLPTVYEVRGFWAETWLSGDRGARAATSDTYLGRQARERACMLGVDVVVTLGDAMKANIIEQGIDESKVVVIPNAVDIERFSPGPRPEALAASLGLGRDDLVVGYVTSMTAYEGIPHLIEALASLRRTGHRVRALLVGDGTARPMLEAMCRRLGVSDSVVFTGWVDHGQIIDYYRLIDVFVIPRSDTRVCQLVTPLKPYEAMAAGCPVVASDVQAIHEMVIDGRTGLLFRAGSTPALVAALDGLLNDPAERARLAGNARAWVAEHRTWGHNARRYVEVYRQLGA
ncbi:MAG: glycosyltransferase family 4 protein [Acidimicrobiales bacterium]